MGDEGERKSGLSSLWENLTKGAQNALELARVGRLSPEVHAPYTVARHERVFKLRRYERKSTAPKVSPEVDLPLLLVPPLMVTAEVYDIDPEISTVTMLAEAGVDVWMVDFGIPEQEEGGLERTLDDHVQAVSHAIDHVRAATGNDVHLAGYSQGGMFCYQTAAYRRSQGIKSLITFGSPVDVHQNLVLGGEVASRVIDSLSGLVRSGLSAMDALPGTFSSRGFRILSAGKELKHMLSFIGNLHDREALMRGESSRKFLHGEGFVAWPGPALRNFYEQFVVQNRMSQGGFVIDGRTLTLADITCPILYFYGERDEFARAPSVRSIREAAPLAESYEVKLRTGHFGLVVGSMALKQTWPTVIDWMRWHEGKGLRPTNMRMAGEVEVKPDALEDVIEANFEDVEYNARLIFDTAKDTASFVRRRVGDISSTLGAMFDNLRYQVPRLARLERIDADSRVSAGLALAEQAERMGEQTFFLWKGRAHSYADSDRRVNAIVRGLIACGVKPGSRVGVLMQARPSYLSLVTAISRLGAVAVLISPEGKRVSLEHALQLGQVEILITDPERAEGGRFTFQGPVLCLGGGGPQGEGRKHVEGVLDMESIDPEQVELPEWYEPNPGRASDLAMVIFTAGKDERPRAARITNRRWAVAAYGAAAASTLTPKDTVYCCMPLDHAAGLLVSVGGALVGGARLALAQGFEPETFWTEVRRYGASVVYYAGEMCRPLVDAPSLTSDDNNPVRLFAGSGMRADVWRRLVERFDTGVLEFYATTEGNAVLANVSGQPVGSLGRPLPGTADVALVAYDFDTNSFVRDAEGKLVRCFADQPGMLIARIDSAHPMASFDGYLDSKESLARVMRDAFEPHDAWFITGDVVRVDPSGNHWFVDRAADMIRTHKGPVSTLHVEDTLYELPEIKHAVVYGLPVPGSNHEMPVATIVVRPGYLLDPLAIARQVERRLDANARPRFVRVRDDVPMSVGYRPMKQPLRDQGVQPTDLDTLAYDQDLRLYQPVQPAVYAVSVAQAGGTLASAAPMETKPEKRKKNGRKSEKKRADDPA
ncbi:MAG: AMP-binding protein [Myxococcales bacterium]